MGVCLIISVSILKAEFQVKLEPPVATFAFFTCCGRGPLEMIGTSIFAGWMPFLSSANVIKALKATVSFYVFITL